MIMVVMAKNALLKFNFAFLICISFLLIEGMRLENEKIRNGHVVSRIGVTFWLEEEMDFEGVSFINCEWNDIWCDTQFLFQMFLWDIAESYDLFLTWAFDFFLTKNEIFIHSNNWSSTSSNANTNSLKTKRMNLRTNSQHPS